MPPSDTLTVRIDPELKAQADQAAKAEDRNLTDFVIRALKQRLSAQCVHCGRTDRPAGGQGRGSGNGPDFQQLLARSPSVTLKDLSKGSMVIVVATEGQAPDTATAITVVAGVEPMLQASTSGSQAMLSSAWNVGGGGGGEGGGGEAPQ